MQSNWVTALKVQAKQIVKYCTCLDRLPPKAPDPVRVEKTPEQKKQQADINVKKRLRDAVSNLTEIFRSSELVHDFFIVLWQGRRKAPPPPCVPYSYST